ncbi:MAG: sulfite exporter TauE/SafE family protein [Burkholderiaceae bacterium]
MISTLTIVSLLALGAVAGFLAGLLGIGGGMLMVPFLVMILATEGIPDAYLVKIAIATSLATILFTSMSSVRAHWRAGAIRWPVVATLTPGIIIGAMIGARLAGLIPSQWLELFFAVFVSYSATQMLRGKSPAKADGEPAERLPSRFAQFAMGGVIGVLSSLVGAGGGFLTVPYLTSRGVRIQNAIATSAACGFPIAASAAIGYVWAGWGLHIGPATFGYIYLPALVLISIVSVMTAPWGARTAHRMPVTKLKRAFACLLYTLAAYMLYRGLAAH